MASFDAHTSLDGKHTQPNIAFNLGVISVCVILAGIGVAYLIDAISVKEKPLPSLVTAGPTIEKTIGGQTLAIPPSWFRFSEQRNPGFTEQIDLLFALPLGTNNAMREVNITLLPASRARSSARLLDAVYLHQFLPQQIEGPLGLIGKPLREAEGFQNETVWYDPISNAPFVAKCSAPVAADMPTTCVRTIALNASVSVTYAFDQELLQQWRRFDEEATFWLTKIGGM